MQEQQVKAGNVIDWHKVPFSALVRREDAYFLRGRRGGHVVGVRGQARSWESWDEMGGEADAWPWHEEYGAPATIIALDVPADATADDLRALAERFEVREAWCGMQRGNLLNLAEAMFYDAQMDADADGPGTGNEVNEFFERLHAAGWRPGMTAEDAARRLAEVTAG